jgi:AraC-like DNA-binding protein
VDALSELLRVIKLDAAIYFNAEMSEPWCLASPAACALAPALSPGASHLIIYHFLREGRAYVETESGQRVDLSPGDIVTFPHGGAHRLGNGIAEPIDVSVALPDVLARGLCPLRFGGGGAETRFICGFLACDLELSQSVLGGLPELVRVNLRDDPSGQWLENSLQFSVTQAAESAAGTGAMLAKLSEVLFAETLRRYVRDLAEGQTGWFAAVRDPLVGQVLTLVHHRPAHPWTLIELARQAGTSRTVLAERFRHYLGVPPMAYLTEWRLRLGARSLASTNHSVARIASEVGYESEASVTRAFKREYGLPPARYRKQHLSQAVASTSSSSPG